MLQIYFCDDVAQVRDSYAQELKGLAQKHGMEVNLQLLDDGGKLLLALGEAPNKADIIYLDIYMQGMTGIEVGKRLRQLGCHAEIIYLTTSESDVFEALDVAPLHYIRKEHSTPEKFEEIFLRAVELAGRKEREYFCCESARAQYHIPIWSIRYFEVSNRIVTVHCGGDTSPSFYSTVERLQSRLDSRRFVRCHRSFVVHLHAVTRVDSKEVTLTGGAKVPVGATYAKGLRAALASFLAAQP